MINLWPRPYQSPHQPVWITGSSDLESIKKAAGRGYVFATFLQPYETVRELFDAYRSAYLDQGLPGGGGTAFMPLVYTGDSEEDAEAGARELIWYMKAKTEPQFRNPPGYVPVDLNVKALQGAFSGRTEEIRVKGLDFQREKGVVMYGTPDQVAQQIRRCYDLVGGFDHLLMMQQAGFLDHKRTVASMTRFARDVLPQIKDLPRTRPNNARGAAE